jgi:Adenylate and Guanylate cyclase catalytic domain/SAM domain (Sterile alpha motif)
MFRGNDIDIELLGRLTNDDLKDIGVVSFGHRKKLLEAIAELAGAFSVPPQPAIEPKAHDAAERRQVTVMFSDLVGSTVLSARMDPEDLREVIAAYQKSVAETVRRFDGFVAKYMGDGVLVYFGYPQAHEDDAERAVRAGLELIAAIVGLKTGASLQTRVGIATGLVVVGDLIGSGEAQERGITARHRTSRHVCKGLPSQTLSSSPTTHEDFSVLFSNSRTLAPKKWHRRCGPGLRCGPVL